MLDLFLFGVLPYLSVALAVGGTIYRRRALRDTLGARSSQLLEGRAQYWGSLPWHNAILLILAAHLGAALFPGAFGWLLGAPGRLYALEITGLGLGALTVVGLAILLARRTRLGAVTGARDWLVLALLLLQAATGVYIAYALRWGSVWYLHTATPWLASLGRLSPQVDLMAVLPPVVKVHAVNAFVLIALVPLTRLVHVVSFPASYLWRPPQVVIWRRPPAPDREVLP